MKELEQFRKEFGSIKEAIDKIIEELKIQSMAVLVMEDAARTFEGKAYIQKILKRVDKLLSYVEEFKESWEADETKEFSKEE